MREAVIVAMSRTAVGRAKKGDTHTTRPEDLTNSVILDVLRQTKDKQLWFLLNHSDEEVTISPAPVGEDLITAKPCSGQLVLPRNGVAVIQK